LWSTRSEIIDIFRDGMPHSPPVPLFKFSEPAEELFPAVLMEKAGKPLPI
jgi:hypothetical protein